MIYDATWYPEPVIHRIIAKNTTNGQVYYTIKGDNNPTADPVVVTPDQIQAKVISFGETPFVIPKIGYITLWIRGL